MEQEKVLRKSLKKRRARGFLSFLMSLIMAIETFGPMQLVVSADDEPVEFSLLSVDDTIAVGTSIKYTYTGTEYVGVDVFIEYSLDAMHVLSTDSNTVSSFDSVVLLGNTYLWTEDAFIPPATFKNWKIKNKDSELVYNTDSKAKVKLTLSPEYNGVSSITYHVDGVVKDYTPSTYVEGVGVSKTDMPSADAKANYSFDTWYSDPEFTAGSKMEYIPADATGDLHLYARYTPMEYGITYETNGGTFIDGYTAPAKYTYGVGVALPTSDKITKSGKVFGGWYDVSDLLGYAITEIGSTISGTETVYAKWVDKEAAVPVVTISGYEYDGTAHEATVSGIPAGYDGTVTVKYIGTGSTVYAASTTAPKNAGTYSVTAETTETATYAAGTSEPCEFTISKADITLTAKPKEITYGENGANDGFECTGLVNGDSADELFHDIDYYYTHNDGEMPYDPNSDGVGSYLIRIDGSSIPDELENYNITNVIYGTLTVNPKSVTAVWDGEDSYEYNGTAQGPTVTSITGLLHEETFTVSGNANTAVGSYTASVAINGDAKDNYTVTNPTYGYSITAAEVDPTVTVLGTYTYDGTQKKPTKENIHVKVGDTVLGSDDFDIVSYGENINAGIEAGSVTVKSSENGSYIFANKTAYFNIGKATPNFSVSIENWEYGGTASTPTISGTITGDGTISYSHKKTGTTEVISGIPTDAGDYTLYATSAETTNYKSYTAECVFSISRKAVTVKADDKGKAFGKDDPELTATVTGTITPDTVTYTLSRAVGEAVGTYTITASGDDTQGNYTVSFNPGTFTITAAAATVTGVTANSRTYDGNAEALVTGGTVTGGTLVYALGENAETAPASGYAAAVPKGTEAGTYFVWYYVDPDSNHTASAKACATVVIEKAGISPTVTITGWKYGEYDSAANAPKLTDGSNPGSGTVGYTYAVKGSTEFKSEVPTNKGDYTVKATIGETDNYKSGEATKDFSITAAQATATAPTANDRTYDGTEKVLVTGGSADFGELVFSTTETGTYLATVPTGTDAGPYIVWYKATGDANHEPSAPASIEVNISKLNITATITGHTDTVTYDGNEHTVTGYAASYSNTLYTDSDYTFTGTKSITQTNANKYNMGLVASQFTNNNNNFSVTFAVTDGWLKIEKAAMEVTKPTANTLTYNGIARALVTAGSVEGGTMKYAVGNDDVTAPDDSKFDAVVPKRANAGNYFVWYLAVPDSNHNKLTVGNPACVTVSIDKATATVTAPTATNPDYNGSAQELVTGGSADFGELVFSTTETGTYSATVPTGTDAGPYIVWYKATGDANHEPSAPASVSCKINPLAVTATITGHTGTETYTGTEYTVSGYDASYSSTLYTDTNYTFTGTDSVSGTNAGTYPMGLKEGDFTNINNSFTVTFDVTDGLLKIEKADIAPTISIASTKVYDGTAIAAATVSGNPESGTETITYVGRDETTYNSTVPPTNVGKYSVYAVVAETANYNGATTESVNFEITAADITPGITITGWTYGEAANDPVVSGNTDHGAETITYTGRNTTTYAESAAVPTGAGDYTVKVVIGATENYNGGTATADFTIAKADIAPTISIASAKVYDGTAIEAATVSGNTGNGTETITYVGRDGTTYNSDVPPTNVGKYSVSAVVAETANYNGATTAAVDFEITAADITPGITITGWTYGEAANDPVVSGNTGSGTETITYTGRNTTTYAESAAVPTGAGDYTVKVVISATENYNGGTATANFTIEQLEAVLSWDDLSFVYDGNEHKPTAVVTNLAGTDTCTVTVDGAQTNAGTYTATASALSNENYKLPTANTQSFTISPLEAVLSWDDLSFVYDGNEHKPTAVVTNLAGTDTCTVTVDGAQTNAGTYTATASALSNGNYKLPAANTQSFTISPLEAVLSWDDLSFVYDGNEHKPTAVVTNLVGTDTCTVTVDGAQTNAGTYTATASALSNENYKLPTANTQSFTISPLEAVLSWDDLSFVYDGNEHKPTAVVTNLAGTDTCTVTVDGAQKNTGTYTATASALSNENYKLPAANTQSFTISPLEAVLSWDDLSFVYDGNEHKPTAVVTNLVGTDTCTVTVDGAQTNAGTYTATASALSNENYKLPTANTQSFTISPLEAVLSWDDLSFVYDGNEHKPTAVVTNLVGTDTCTVTVDGAQTNAGTYTATASALSNENYKLPAANTQSFTIAQIPVTVKADDKTKTYGEEDPEFTAAVSGTLGSDTVSYTISRDAGKNIGFYTITPSGDASQGNYSVTFETASLEIVAADMTITAPTANTLTYTGADMSLVTAGTVIGGTMKYAPGADDTTAPALTEFDAAVPTGRNAGTFYVWYIALPDGNHNETTETPACVKVTIAKADPIVTPPAAKTLNYTAEAQELITAGNAVGGTMTYSTEKEGTYSGTLPTGTNVGTYTVWYKVTGDENHNDIAPASVEAVIEDTARIITPPTGKTGLRFNGRMQVLIYAGSTNFGKMVYSLDEVNYSEELPQALYDGTYTVWYKVIEDVLHGDSEPASLQVTIASPRHGPSGTPVPVTPSPTPSSHVTPSAGGEDSDPEVNTLLSAKLIENNNLLVTWKKIDKAKKYVLYAKKDDGEYVVVSTTEKMRVVIKNPKINVTYHLMLKYSSSDTVVSDDLKGGTSEYRTSLYVSVSPKITNITRSGSKNKITWEKMKGVKTYYVCRLENNKPVIIKKTSELSATVAGSKSTKYVVLAKINKKWTKARKSDAKSYQSFHRT